METIIYNKINEEEIEVTKEVVKNKKTSKYRKSDIERNLEITIKQKERSMAIFDAKIGEYSAILAEFEKN